MNIPRKRKWALPLFDLDAKIGTWKCFYVYEALREIDRMAAALGPSGCPKARRRMFKAARVAAASIRLGTDVEEVKSTIRAIMLG